MHCKKILNSSGNALFLILIAVALFAALSYAITNSSRGGVGIDKEQAELDAAVASQCDAAVEYGVNKLKIIQGCDDDQISYELSDGTNENPNNTSDTSCFVFDNDGAGVTACGTYLDAVVNLGQPAFGDTSLAFNIGGGVLGKCAAYGTQDGSSGECTDLQFSTDGGNTFANAVFCEVNGGTSDTLEFASTYCNAACGLPFGTVFRTSSSSPTIANDDGTISPYAGETCGGNRIYTGAHCSCWST